MQKLIISPATSFAQECACVVAAAKQYAERNPEGAPFVGHIDSAPGAAVYIRNVNQISRYLAPGARVLDWGCGFGQVAYSLANRGFQVSACDWPAQPRMPELVDERITYFRLEGDGLKVNAPDQSFDAVISSGSLEHSNNMIESMREIRRILKNDGWFFIFRFPNDLSISEYIARKTSKWGHGVRMSREEFRFFMRMFSFRIEKLGYDSFLPIFFGHRLRSLRPLREKLDGPITVLDRILTETPVISRFSTSIYCFAQVTYEFQNE